LPQVSAGLSTPGLRASLPSAKQGGFQCRVMRLEVETALFHVHPALIRRNIHHKPAAFRNISAL
jgi:hypothetical protein